MDVYLLFDNHDNYKFLEKKFENCIYSPKCSKKFCSWILGALKCLRVSKRKDLIVCWFDFQAVLLYWLSLVTFRSRKILCLNVMLKQKKTLRNKIVTILYKKALSSKNFKATITSREYGLLLNKLLKKKYDFALLHDVYHDYYECPLKLNPAQNSVFCGGRNGRDWPLMLEVAKKLNDVQFNFVVPKSVYEKQKNCKPSNVRFFVDVSYERFMSIMCMSKIVCLPLDTDAPAGLIVLFQAAANDKFLIATDTATMREYINESRGILLPRDTGAWIKTISRALQDKRDLRCENMKNFLQSECSEEKFLSVVEQCCSEFEN